MGKTLTWLFRVVLLKHWAPKLLAVMRRALTLLLVAVSSGAGFVVFSTSAADPETLLASSPPLTRPLPAAHSSRTITFSTAPAPFPEPTVPTRSASPTPLPPADLVAALGEHMAHPALTGLDASVSVWMEGYGEVFAHNPDLELYPASNQKLLTAMGALSLLPADFRFYTEMARDDQTGDLVLVAGGDPTLTEADLAHLAEEVSKAEVLDVPGDLVVDAARYEPVRMAPGWLDWQMPRYVGPLSTFVVNDNRHRTDPVYLAEPDLGNAELLRSQLTSAGVTVAGATLSGPRPRGAETIAVVSSPQRDDLVGRLLTHSDNEIAEALVREVGLLAVGTGSTTSGLRAMEYNLRSLGIPLPGQSGDGSGLSRSNLRSARAWQQLLVAATNAEWWPVLWDRLPVAGHTGTLARRLTGVETAGKVRAKTGSIIDGRALSGYVETEGGLVVFSFVVNGQGAGAAIPVMDELVKILANYSA